MTFLATPAPIVVDASIAVEQILEEAPRGKASWDGWVTAQRTRLVPSHFWPEVANALLVGNRIEPDRVRQEVGLLGAAGIESVPPHERRLLEAIDLASQYRLTIYDALYLQLALETDASLGTLDSALRRAAEAEGIEVETLD
ncbi:MAG: type II toxin-antitoxin system VapC family toxin [Candidatus Limnocylindrales bacterium]